MTFVITTHNKKNWNENIFHKQSLAAVNECRNISRIHSGIRRASIIANFAYNMNGNLSFLEKATWIWCTVSNLMKMFWGVFISIINGCLSPWTVRWESFEELTQKEPSCVTWTVELLYLLHVAAQFRVGRFVDSVPVHWYFDLLVQLEDHQGVVDVSAAQTNTSRGFAVVIWRICSYSQHAACQRRTEEERWGVLRVEMVDTRVDSQWVHPVPEGALLSGFTWKQTNKQTKKSAGKLGHRDRESWESLTYELSPLWVLSALSAQKE